MKAIPALLLVFAWRPLLSAGEPAEGSSVAAIDQGRLRAAVERGLQVVEKAARSYPRHRECFSCHHQTLPMQAMVVAREHGFRIDQDLLLDQGRFTHRSFGKRIPALKKGEDIGGASMTVGYGLWALELVDWKRDELTDAMVAFLLKNQDSGGRWTRFTSRPPLEDSNITCTVLAAHFLQRFTSAQNGPQGESAVDRARSWLLAATPESQEDRSFRLWGLLFLNGERSHLEPARAAVLSEQREDGGFGQLPGMPSDAYATGQTLFVLSETGMAADAPAFRRGIRFLIETQKEDGSWFVKSRSKPIQAMFDNGDPHGTDQFISTPATAWATMALARALPRPRLRRF